MYHANRHHRRFPLGRSLALAAAALAVASAPASATTPSEAATKIRQIEDGGAFRPPTPNATFSVGTFNAGTGAFSGTVTKDQCAYDPDLRAVICEPGATPRVLVNGVHVGLQFAWSNATGSVTVTVNGQSKTVSAGLGKLVMPIGRARSASWRIAANGRSYTDALTVDRPEVLGAGVFTIKALPIGIAYEPPQDLGKRNRVRYTRVTTTSTKLTSSFDATTGRTVPKATTQASFVKAASSVGAAAAGSGNPYLAAAGKGLQQIGAVVGETNSDVTTEQVSGSSTTVGIKLEDGMSCTTADRIGPGGGDQIVYLKNARLVWMDDGRQTTLALLGSSGPSCASVAELKSGASPLDAPTEQALLAVDPLSSGGPNMVLPSTRYSLVREIDLGPSTEFEPRTDTHHETEWTSLGTVSVSRKVTTDTLKAGLLSFLGVGPEQTETVVTSLSTSTARTDGIGTAVTTEATLHTLDNGASSTLNAYYDRAFGTIVYQEATPSAPAAPTS